MWKLILLILLVLLSYFYFIHLKSKHPEGIPTVTVIDKQVKIAGHPSEEQDPMNLLTQRKSQNKTFRHWAAEGLKMLADKIEDKPLEERKEH